MNTAIMIVGVGGQGTLLASKILGAVMRAQGLDVKVSEVHGMSQRGGSVVTYVRYGHEIASPIIDKGEADVILAFEQLEALRWLPWLKPGGTVIVNTQRIDPVPVITGEAAYPANVQEQLRATGATVLPLNALAIAQQVGNAKAVNVVLLGVLARQLDIAPAVWEDAIRATVQPRFVELNLRAFAAAQ